MFPTWRRVFQINALESNQEYNILNEIRKQFPNTVNHSENSMITGFVANLILKPDATPIFHKAYTVPYSLIDEVENDLNQLVKDGILVPTETSQWASPAVIVKKKNGKVRVCLDGKVTVNRMLSTTHYPLPHVDDILSKISKWKYFCKLDLTAAYLQVPLSKASQEICTINTHKGLYRYTRMPFGISSAPAIFQGIIDQILLGSPGMAYIDDILVGGATTEECKRNLFLVLDRLNKHRVKLNLEKSEFFKSSIDYLGYNISASGIKPNLDKVKAIAEVASPRNVNELQAFLGLLNFYRRFLPNLSAQLYPLHALLKKNTKFNWDSKCEEVFQETKQMLINHKVLEPYDPSKPIVLAVDASPYGVGAVLSHVINKIEKPIAFASATLTEAQKNYAHVHKEALAVMFGVNKFHKYIFGFKFKLVTDNSGVKEIFNPTRGTSSIAMARLQRWALTLSNYDYVIEQRPGTMMSNADAMSRLPLVEAPSVENIQLGIKAVQESGLLNDVRIRYNQQEDPLIKTLYERVKGGWTHEPDYSLKPFFKLKTHFGLEDGILCFNDRIVVPESLKSLTLTNLHQNHEGIVKMKMNARQHVWWKTMDKDLTEFVKSCKVCQLRQIVPKEVVVTKWPSVEGPFQRVHLDLFYIESRTLLIIVDAFSKYIDVRLLNLSRASDIIENLENFFACFGLPQEIVTDNGPPFNSVAFENFLNVRGIKVSKSPPYHPQSNGLAERAVRTVKEVIKKFMIDEKVKHLSLTRKINRFLTNYRNTPCTVTKVTPASRIFSYVPTTIMNSMKPKTGATPLKKSSMKKQFSKPNVFNTSYMTKTVEFKEGEKALYRNHFKELFRWIPVTIYKKLSILRYLVNINGNIRMVHVNQLKKNSNYEPITLAQPQTTKYEEEKELSDKVKLEPKPSRKRARSESSSPPIRRSERLKGQPRKKYPK
ncbi:uncharacterized protein K02A2.6-like isoform X1 [Anopheles funestus]|uniref:uncharacterized protein K02A2.6-like isoform X1 n=1 Tax=Anopheles funestus TaxID=62324 RepID=UPI0020C5D1D4|nr:uncharacterized protein K02A2.6-like isoform X1 [Anopheles funestus]